MIQVSVAGIGLDNRAQHIVILNDQQKVRALPIWIGRAEAQAIGVALEHVKAKRPMTHQLLNNIIEQLGYVVSKVEIDSVKANTYLANIVIDKKTEGDQQPEQLSIDARPSDAIAVALLANAPIWVSPEVMSAGSFLLEEHEEERQKFKEFVQNVKASDFRLPPQDSAGKDDKPDSGPHSKG